MVNASTLFAILALLFQVFVITSPAAVTSTVTSNFQIPNADENWDINDDFVPYEGHLNEEFDCNLFKALSSVAAGNLLVSPPTIKLLLTMLYEGAAGSTKTELQEVLHLSDSAQATRERAQTILNSLKVQSKHYVLNFGSRMYMRHDIRPRDRFLAIIEKFYQTELFDLIDTKKSPAVESINKWVEKVTLGKIKNIVTQDDVANAALLLVNSLYFKGNWVAEFPANQTSPASFYVTPKKNVTVDYMSRKGRYFYLNSRELQAKIVRIPYKGHKFSMFIIVPHSNDGLPQLMHNLNPENLRSVLWIMDELIVNVTIPKFNFEISTQLSEVLKNMGLKTLFTDDASLLGLVKTPEDAKRLKVSNLLQKAGLEINEQGSIAAAATELVIIDKIDNGDVNFNANHPFLFFIQDETTGTIIFIGKLEDPLATKSEILNKRAQPLRNS